MSIMKSGKAHVLLMVVVAVVIIGAILFVNGNLKGPEKPKDIFQRGMCYVTWSKDRLASSGSDESLAEMVKTGTTCVAIVPTWYQDNCNSNNIFQTQNSPSDESVVHAIKTSHELGMRVMLKPHLDLLNSEDGSWRGQITCSTDPDWKIWFESYKNFIVHYAKLAQDNGVELFCVGTELKTVATKKSAMWREYVIAPVRQVFKGKITYAANWDEEYAEIDFWDALDFIGIDAYFPLVEYDNPTYDDIKKGWQTWVGSIEEVQKKFNKPVIFPEVGYCSAKGAASTPWEDLGGGVLDLQLQADCYRALFETFWDKDYFYGMYWWKWGTDKRFGGMSNKGFSPQNKPALDFVRQWYAKPTPEKKKF